MLAYEANPYARARHEAFVASSWCHGARKPWELLSRHLRRPETRCLIAHSISDPESLYGWACVASGAVVWVYVRDWPSTLRRQGLATTLLLECGADVSKPTPCLYWSPYATAMAERGYRLYYAPQRRTQHARASEVRGQAIPSDA